MGSKIQIHSKSARRAIAIWSTVTAVLSIAILQPSAYGLEFPASSTLTLPSANPFEVQTDEATPVNQLGTEIVPIEASLFSELSSEGTVSAISISIVSSASARVELARTPEGAKEVAKVLMDDQYGWGNNQFECLNSLWTNESHWNYKSSNKSSGAHGIPQALPATKMDSVATDWRTNPVTQISWGLRYIDQRYSTPCKAWSKFKRSNWY
jgi:hypothetical protein